MYEPLLPTEPPVYPALALATAQLVQASAVNGPRHAVLRRAVVTAACRAPTCSVAAVTLVLVETRVNGTRMPYISCPVCVSQLEITRIEASVAGEDDELRAADPPRPRII